MVADRYQGAMDRPAMKLRFLDMPTAIKFEHIVNKHGYTTSVNNEGRWIVVESAVDGKAKKQIMDEWRRVSLEDNSKPDPRQKEFKL